MNEFAKRTIYCYKTTTQLEITVGKFAFFIKFLFVVDIIYIEKKKHLFKFNEKENEYKK